MSKSKASKKPKANTSKMPLHKRIATGGKPKASKKKSK